MKKQIPTAVNVRRISLGLNLLWINQIGKTCKNVFQLRGYQEYFHFDNHVVALSDFGRNVKLWKEDKRWCCLRKSKYNMKWIKRGKRILNTAVYKYYKNTSWQFKLCTQLTTLQELCLSCTCAKVDVNKIIIQLKTIDYLWENGNHIFESSICSNGCSHKVCKWKRNCRSFLLFGT